MRFSIALIALAAPYLVSAAPFKRAEAGDLTVLKFADALEQLESTFYSQALQKFKESDFQTAGFSSAQIPIEQFTLIQVDEATHSTVLQGAIKANGGTPIAGCKFDFSSVLGDVATMAATARLVENVGVGAYLGAASLVKDPVLLTAAASILTIEARHQTILNLLGGATSIPQAFDIALSPPQVLAIAGPFVTGCDLGVPANPTLTVTNTGAVTAGTALTFKSAAINGTVPEDKLFCQMLAGGLAFSITLPLSGCVVPEGLNGPVAVFVTSDEQPLTASIVNQATDKLIAGPTMAFIDVKPDTLGQFLRSSSGSASASESTSTISSGDANAIVSSASSDSASATGSDTAAPSATASSSDGSSSAASGGSSDSASSSASSGAAAPSGSVSGSLGTNNAAASGPQPNTFVGLSPDGNVKVNGWTNLPTPPA